MLDFLVKAAILVGLFYVAQINLNNLDSYAAAIVAPRTNPEAILDLQISGFTCAQAATLLGSFSPSQRESLKKIYTDLYDVYWPGSLMVAHLFLVFFLTPGRLSRWLLFPVLLFGLDMLENVLNLDMMRVLESQVAAGKPIDLSPNCVVVGSFLTPLKWGLVPVFYSVVIYLLVSNIFCGRKVDSKKKAQ